MKKIAGWGLLLLSADILGISIFAFIGVIFSDDVARFVGDLLGTRTEKDTLEFLGLGISGMIAFFGLFALAAQDQFKAAVKIVVKKLDFLYLLLGILIIFVIAFFTVMGSDDFANLLGKLFGIKTGTGSKKETLQFLGWIISGFAGLFGLLILSRRVAAQEKGLVQDRFKAAVEHLANKRTSVRIASFYEFFYLARDVPDYAENILSILCAHLRHTSNDEESKQEITEQQTMIDILFSPKAENIFGELNYDFQRVKFLPKINFVEIHKIDKKVDLFEADLSEARFGNTDLSGFRFRSVTLRNAFFWMTDLQKVFLFDADLSEANFYIVNMSGTNLREANLSGANLYRVNLSDADLFKADLRGANLSTTKNLQTADLSKTKYGKDTNGKETKFPEGFKPEDHDMIYCPPEDKKPEDKK